MPPKKKQETLEKKISDDSLDEKSQELKPKVAKKIKKTDKEKVSTEKKTDKEKVSTGKKSDKEKEKVSAEKKSDKVKKEKVKETDSNEPTKKKSVSPKKKNDSNEEYEKLFEDLKDKYIQLCKKAHDIQVELNIIDEDRENVLNDIRKLQLKFNPKLNIGLNIDDIVTSDNLTQDVSANLIKISSTNSLSKITMKKKKPLRSTDMETDDSESENLENNIECSDTDTE